MSGITKIAAAGNGQEMYAGRIPAWDGLGQRFTTAVTAQDTDQILRMANLDFEFHKDTVQDSLGNVIPGSEVVYREVQGGPNDGKREFSGIVKGRHELLQPREVAELAKAAFGDSLCETAGMLKNSRIWMQFQGEKEFILDPNGVSDRVLNYSTITTTADGSGCTLIGDSIMRWNCANVITGDLRGTKWEHKVRHTATQKARLALIVKAIAAKRVHWETFQIVAKDMFEAPFSDKQFQNAVVTLNTKRPEDNEKGRLTKWENMMDSHIALWNAQHNAGIRGTAWGAWQVLIERNQWGRNIQNTPNGLQNFYSAGMGFDNVTNSYRQRALDLVAARAGVDL